MSSRGNDTASGREGDAAELARRLRETREYLSFSQQYVSEETGIPRPAISQIERGERRVESLELKRLSRLYGYPVSYFLGEEEALEDDQAVQSLARLAQELSPHDREEVYRFANYLRHVGRSKR
jgi:transcriptional regulator with XRE-family HTH domain